MESDGLSEDQVRDRIAANRNQGTPPRQAVQTQPRTSKARGRFRVKASSASAAASAGWRENGTNH
jgi:hypothetical protein